MNSMTLCRPGRKQCMLGLLGSLLVIYWIYYPYTERTGRLEKEDIETLMEFDFQEETKLQPILPEEPPRKTRLKVPEIPTTIKSRMSYNGRFETPTSDLIQNIVNNPAYEEALDRFEAPEINFLPNYRNPCWFELVDLSSAYKHNFYSTLESSPYVERYISSFNIMKGTLEQRLHKEKGVGRRQTWRIRCLPYFYMIGAPRSGTTDLFAQLSAHSSLLSGEYKEPTYWNRLRYSHPVKPWLNNPKIDNKDVLESPREVEMKLQGDFRSLKHYVESFDRQAEKIRVNDLQVTFEGGPPFHPTVFGDCSPSYLWDFDSWDQLPIHKNLDAPSHTIADYIHNVSPKAKFILLLRNPIDRLYSEYKAFLTRQSKSAKLFHNKAIRAVSSFEDCVSKTAIRHCLYNFTINTQPEFAPLRIRIGLYSQYLLDWFKLFPREQFYINTMEEYKYNRKLVLKEIFDFLELDELSESALEALSKKDIVNSSGGNSEPMMPQTFNLLANFYQPWNDELAEILNDDKYRWQT